MENFNINGLLDKLSENENLINILIQFESFLDNLDLYVFDHWFDGEIVSGPDIKRYWVSVTLKYPYKKKPDPNGAMRLVKQGIKVKYKKSYEEISVFPEGTKKGELIGTSKKTELKKVKIWLVTISIPRKFIEELDDSDLELYANEVNVDEISGAREDNIDSGSGILDDDIEEENDEI